MGHLSHSDFPSDEVYSPAIHSRHVEETFVAMYSPALQFEHVSTHPSTDPTLYVPVFEREARVSTSGTFEWYYCA